MGKVNSKRAKLVKAKVKSAKVVEAKADKLVIKQGEAEQGVPKQSEADQDVIEPIESIVSAFVYPNKGKYEVNSVKINIAGKDQDFKASTKAKLDIDKLKLNDMLKQLFKSLSALDANKFMYGYKNVYNYAFGIVPKGFNSYKCVIAHHNGNGQRALLINSNKHFGMTEIEKALTAGKLTYENHKTYVLTYVSKENIDKLIKACSGLVSVTKTVG